MLIGSLLPILVGLPSGWFWSTFNRPLRVPLHKQLLSISIFFLFLLLFSTCGPSRNSTIPDVALCREKLETLEPSLTLFSKPYCVSQQTGKTCQFKLQVKFVDFIKQGFSSVLYVMYNTKQIRNEICHIYI